MKRSALLFVALLTSSILVSTGGAALSGGFCASGPFSDKHATVVHMRNNCFSPTVVRVAPGDEVTWVNDDLEFHALGGVTNSFGDMHSEIAPEDTISYTFESEGVFPYVCIIHPGMAGAVVVGDGVGDSTGAAGAGEEPGGSTTETGADESSTASAARPGRTASPGPTGPLVVALGVLVLAAGAVLLWRRRPDATGATGHNP